MSNQENFTLQILHRLSEARESLSFQWLNPVGTKTRHFVIDDLLDESICELIYNSFPKDGDGFFNRESFREKKRTSANLQQYAPVLSDITYAFQDRRVVDLISNIVGFEQIEPDPMLYAGGLSMMFQNDFLNPHLDNSHDGQRKRYRRLNLLYYVSPRWRLSNGGNLELWNESKTEPKTIVANPNRLVVMETNKSSWHSVSPVCVSEPRCCVSNYYFSLISPDESNYFHVTSFSGRPDERLKNFVGAFDNILRNTFSKIFKAGRGRGLINKNRK